MDADLPEAFARSLAGPGPRRALVRLLTGAALGVRVWQQTEPAQRVAAKKCSKITDKRKRKNCRKKANQRAGPASPPPLGCAQTCAGCCDASEVCRAGTTTANCGRGGEACATCTGDQVCTTGDCTVPACGAGGPCLVFVTSTTHQGNLKGTSASGLAGADAICQNLADNAASPLPGTYMAWLSDSTGSPDNRFVKSTGPYRRLDGETVADNYADLTTCDGSDPFACLDAPIDLMEDGVTRTNNALVWTKTVANGTEETPRHDCNGWTQADASLTGNIGMSDPIVTARGWTDLDSVQFCGGTVACRLYCFQQS